MKRCAYYLLTNLLTSFRDFPALKGTTYCRVNVTIETVELGAPLGWRRTYSHGWRFFPCEFVVVDSRVMIALTLLESP